MRVNVKNSEEVMRFLNSSIFDCLIYKGYGHRVAARDHEPYRDAHFALELGLKDYELDALLEIPKTEQLSNDSKMARGVIPKLLKNGSSVILKA